MARATKHLWLMLLVLSASCHGRLSSATEEPDAATPVRDAASDTDAGVGIDAASDADAGNGNDAAAGIDAGREEGDSGTVPTAPTLSIHPRNPRYFADASGNPLYLTGSHTWFVVQYQGDVPSAPMPTRERMDAFLDYTQSFGHNFVRLWTNFSYLTYPPFPWVRTSTPGARDGTNKLDLSRFDAAYFDALRERVRQVTSRGMYCSVLLFGSGIGITGNLAGTVWHPDNNVNAEAAAFLVGNGFYTEDPAALELQRALVRRIIDTLNDEPNLMWEIINEADGTKMRWQNAMVDYVREYESHLPRQHLVVMNLGGQTGSANSSLYASHADAISPTVREDDYTHGGPASYASKPVLLDTDHTYGFSLPAASDSIRRSIWEGFLRGRHTLFMDSYDSVMPDAENVGVINTAFDGVRRAMGHTRDYAARLDLAAAVPSETACSTRYCMTAPGQYLVYAPTGGSFTVILDAAAYAFEWFNPLAGAVQGTGRFSISAPETRSFTPPFSGDAVLFVRTMR